MRVLHQHLNTVSTGHNFRVLLILSFLFRWRPHWHLCSARPTGWATACRKVRSLPPRERWHAAQPDVGPCVIVVAVFVRWPWIVLYGCPSDRTRMVITRCIARLSWKPNTKRCNNIIGNYRICSLKHFSFLVGLIRSIQTSEGNATTPLRTKK